MFYLGLTIGVVLGFFVCAIMVLSSRESRYEEILTLKLAQKAINQYEEGWRNEKEQFSDYLQRKDNT